MAVAPFELMRIVNILCDGGLGNRLNSLIGGLIVAETLQARARIFWPENNWCGCSFGDLFAGALEVSNQGIRHLFSLHPDSAYLIHSNQINAPLSTVLKQTREGWAQLRSLDTDVVYYHDAIPEWIARDQILRVLHSIPIRAEIAEKALEFCGCNGINAGTWGLHVRKTDYSAHPLFDMDLDGIYRYVSLDEGARYYICSDDQATEDHFSALDNVCAFPKTSFVQKYRPGGWNDRIIDDQGRESNFNVNRPRQSVIEAFIALLILSRTRPAFDSPSTFLGYAKLYSSINLKTNRLRPSWQRIIRDLWPAGPRQFRIRRKLRSALLTRH